MRTNKDYGVLLAGVKGWKIYFKGFELILVKGKKNLMVDKDKRQLVIDYVNLNYKSASDAERIKKDFLNYLEVMSWVK